MTRLMNRSSYIRYMIMGFLALFIAACEPTAEFTVAPDEIIVGKEITFDASKSVAQKAEKGNVIEQYSWNFGDGEYAQGKVVTHTYTQAGKYAVVLEVMDKAGVAGYMSKTITVLPATTQPMVDATVNIETSNGALLNAAQVSINGVEVATNKQGQATLNVPKNDNDADYVITAKAEGFVTQSISVKATDLNNVRLTLLAEKFTTTVEDIAKGVSIATNILGASVSIPDNGFVTKAGTPATGKATVVITPWDINSADSQAFLGNAQAIDAQGNAAELISAGMMTVDFYDANGDKLQLADGKTAQIRMKAPNKSINGVALNNGTTIPMWTFDEAKGKWVEEGQGSVSVENNVPYVVADVKHFSTWNWDFKFEAGGSINIQCVDAANAGVPCQVNAAVTLPDGSQLSKYRSLNALGATIVNMPTEATVVWFAKTNDGLTGRTEAKISDGDVKVRIKPVTTTHFVTCSVADGSKTACEVEATAKLKDGSEKFIGSYNLTASGATIRSNVSNIDSITLKGISRKLTKNSDGKVVRLSGNASANVNANADIALTTETEVSDYATVECATKAIDGTAIDRCNLSIIESLEPGGIEIVGPDGVIIIIGGEAAPKRLFGSFPTGKPVLIDLLDYDFSNKNYPITIKADQKLKDGTEYEAFVSYSVGKGTELSTVPDTVLTLKKKQFIGDDLPCNPQIQDCPSLQ